MPSKVRCTLNRLGFQQFWWKKEFRYKCRAIRLRITAAVYRLHACILCLTILHVVRWNAVVRIHGASAQDVDQVIVVSDHAWIWSTRAIGSQNTDVVHIPVVDNIAVRSICTEPYLEGLMRVC